MKTNTISCLTTTLAFALVGATAAPTAAKGAGTIPATLEFASTSIALTGDTAGLVYSDGLYVAADGVIYAGVSNVSNGSYFFRTDKYGATAAQNGRFVTLNFSNVVTAPTQSTLNDPNDASGAQLHLGDAQGSINLIPDLRIVADKLFSTTAHNTSVIVPFSLQSEFTGNADFELDFEQAVPFTSPSANVRVLTATGANAVATLYVVGKTGKKTSVGRFSMPFTLTVTRN